MLKRILELGRFVYKYIKRESCKIMCMKSLILLFCASLIYIPIPNLLGRATNLLNEMGMQNRLSIFLRIMVALIILYLTRYALSIYSKSQFSKMEKLVVTRIKLDMLEKYMDMQMEEIESESKGVIMGRIEEASQLSQLFSSGFVGLILGLFEFLFSLIAIAIINYKFFLILILVIPIYYMAIKKISSQIAEATVDLYQSSNDLTGKIFEAINGIMEIKLLNAQVYILKGIKENTQKLVETSYKQNRLLHVFSENIQLMYNIVNICIMLFSALFILLGEIDFATYIILTAYISKILSFIQGFSSIDAILQPIYVAMDRIKKILHYKNESCDKQITIEQCSTIEFNNVDFRYKDSQKNILKNFNIKFSMGDQLLIKGPIGVGKSTIIKLIMGVYKPVNGEIYINHIPINRVDYKSLREKIGIVSQDVILFNDTIKNNILLGTEKNAKELDIIIQEWELNDFINSFENGLNTVISKNSIGVSGGQAKMIAFLRAIVGGKDLIILDEFSSNLDEKLVNKIIGLVKNMERIKSLIVICHSKDWDYINKVIKLDENP